MTFCLSLEVFIKLNPVQVNIKGGGPSLAGRKPVQELSDFVSYSTDCSVILQVSFQKKKLVERNK